MERTLTKKGFIALLQSSRGLYAYVVLSPENGITVKQSKQTWIERVKISDCDAWDVIVDEHSIFVG